MSNRLIKFVQREQQGHHEKENDDIYRSAKTE